jgi:hypothetical protein
MSDFSPGNLVELRSSTGYWYKAIELSLRNTSGPPPWTVKGVKYTSHGMDQWIILEKSSQFLLSYRFRLAVSSLSPRERNQVLLKKRSPR